MAKIKGSAGILSYTTLLFLILLEACSKEHLADNTTQNTVQGTLYYRNYYTGSAELIPLPFTKAFIRLDNASNQDTSIYFASTVTDNQGKFAFYIPDKTKAYQLFSAFSIRSSDAFITPYYGQVSTNLPYKSDANYEVIAMVDSTAHNGLNLYTLDKEQNILPGVQVFIYNSPAAAITDAAFTGIGASYKGISDSLGKCLFMNVTGILYCNAVLRFNASVSFSITAKKITVQHTGIRSDSLRLQ